MEDSERDYEVPKTTEMIAAQEEQSSELNLSSTVASETLRVQGTSKTEVPDRTQPERS